jgi:hypothetical protein
MRDPDELHEDERFAEHDGTALFLVQFLCVYGVAESLWKAFASPGGPVSVLGTVLVFRAALLGAAGYALIKRRPWGWAAAVTASALYAIVIPTALFVSMPKSLSRVIPNIWMILLAAGLVSFVTLAMESYALWRRYAAFGIARRHRWRMLVRGGLPASLVFLAVDGLRYYLSAVYR